jgi:glucose-1-phosphate adenylyltransferase
MRRGDSWYAGTADAVFQNLYLLQRSNADQVIILSGDHIYRMDYQAMLDFHCQNLADVTVACMTVPRDEASAFGVMGVDVRGQVREFQEKPPTPPCVPGDPHHALVSMGIYVFSRRLLCDVLSDDAARKDSSHDFGKDILPRLVGSHHVYGYRFGGPMGRVTNDSYWRDVGTLDAYFQANMDLLKTNPPLDLYQPDWTIRTTERQSPPARTVRGPGGQRADVDNVLFAGGSVVSGSTIHHSIVSRDVHVEEGAIVENAVLFDGVRIGAGAMVRNCIIDKEVMVPAGETIGYDLETDRRRFMISDQGIVVVRKDYRFEGVPAPHWTRNATAALSALE